MREKNLSLLLLSLLVLHAWVEIVNAKGSHKHNHDQNQDALFDSKTGHRLSPTDYATMAVSLSFVTTRDLATYTSSLMTRRGLTSPRTISALHDCYGVLRGAELQLRRSFDEMSVLIEPVNESWNLPLSNVQSWLSAALVNDETCLHRVNETEESPMKLDILDRISAIMKYTSVARTNVMNLGKVPKASSHKY
ncbi:hypothetical protein GIB67_006133 [Kingdonia uniflora]|uniref:Pectinesterase inhibitor domain-containing protein n=1 Tax=Kingdonia uniflora TaxID=39325 RepID=A0A7J7LPP9_9MAGN|nr:hypothetical protein GIB67_006133 [Kingdonia uniflora]